MHAFSRSTLGIGLAIAIVWGAPTVADDVGPDALRKLEDENAWMRERLTAQEERLARLEADRGETEVTSAFSITLGGFLKTDTLWNDSRVNSTSAPRFAARAGGSDDQFTMTVQHSRLWARIDGPPVGSGRIHGYIETDLFNFGAGEDTNFSNNDFRVRQLYAKLEFERWSVLLGEAWDLFSPLNVPTLNTNGNNWFGGNGGFRRPQLRGSFAWSPAEAHKLTLAASINANGGVPVVDSGQTTNSGRDSGIPVFQGSATWAFDGFAAGTIQAGVSGLWGREQFDDIGRNTDQWGVALHGVLPLLDWLSLAGEVQYGGNLDSFLMGGGVNPSNGKAIRGVAGWVRATVKPRERMEINLIYGEDDPRNGHLAVGDRSNNRVISANLKQTVYPNFVVGLEFDRFVTDYVGSSSRDANVLWVSGIFDF